MRERLIELARLSRLIPGGPTGELHERERVLAMIGISILRAPRAVVMASNRRVSFRDLRERSAKRKAILWASASVNA
jgi:hypothetical protein